jgi:glycosyltransferase involved in cell wall biosynthesis
LLLKAKDEADLQENILPANRFRIIHVGRLVSWKRVDLILNAAAALKYRFPAIEVLIIGDGPKRNELEKLAESLGITENVRFIGAVYDPVLLGRYYKASSVYVLAGMGGLSINEAMIYGKPVICSAADGTEKKLVRDNFNGKYFEKGNLENLVEKIDFLLCNPKLIEDMGKNSQKIILEEVNIHTVITGYIRAFNYVTRNKYQLNY